MTLWLLVFALYSASGSGHSTFGDGYLLFRTARSLVDAGSFAIDPVPGAGGVPQRQGTDGRVYAVFAPGFAFAQIPMIVLGRVLPAFVQPRVRGEPCDALQRDEFWASFTNAWVGSTTVVLVWLCGMALGFSHGASMTNALLLAVASPLWCYARTDGSEALQASLLTGAMLALLRAPYAAGRAGVLVAGVLLGLSVLTKLADAALVPWFALYCAGADGALAGRVRACAALIAPVVAALLLYAGYDFLRFGSALDVGYLMPVSFFGVPLTFGIAILLFSPSSGLFFFWPATALVLLGAWWLGRAHPRAAMLIAGVLVTLLLLYATNWAFWQFAWGPRYLVPAIPLLALFLLPVLSRSDKTLRGALLLAAALGIGVQMITATASWWHQVLPVYAAVRRESRDDLLRDPRVAPLRVGVWWIGLVTAEHLEGPAHASLRLLHPPWEEAFPWQRPGSTLPMLWDLRGLDLWAAPESWRMPYRSIGRTSAGLAPIATSRPLRLMLAVLGLAALLALIRDARRRTDDRVRAARAPCQSSGDVS